MNTRSAVFSCTALQGTNKAGDLKPDENGYYTLVLGALNVFNSAGAFYALKGSEDFFKESSVFMRRVQSGCLKAECGHPKKSPAMSMRDWLNRVMSLEETNICCHIADVWLDYQNVKDENGRPIVAIMGKIKPAGPRGPALKEALDNPRENVCFSIRSLTDDRRENGVIVKYLNTIVAFDWVTEPGINFARKYFSPALESLTEMLFTSKQLDEAEEHYRGNHPNFSFESNGVDYDSIREGMGWDKPTAKVAPSSKW